MKILGIILALLMLSGSALIGTIGAGKARDVASDVAKLGDITPQMKAMIEKSGESIPSKGRLSTGAIIGYLAALACVVLLVVTFAKKDLVTQVAGAAVGLTLLSALIYPYVKTGPTEGMAPRTQAIVALVLAAIGAGGSFLAARKRA